MEILLCGSDADPADYIAADEAKDLVYHCEMYIGGCCIMMSDSPGESGAQNYTMSLVVTFDTADEVKAAFGILSDGCTVIHPMKSTTYSSCFVSLVDRFGMRWELMTEQTER